MQSQHIFVHLDYSFLHYTIYINGYLCLPYLFPIFFIFYRIHSTAGFCIQHEVKACIFTETTGIAQERVLFVIINGPGKFKTDNYNYSISFLGLCTIFIHKQMSTSSPSVPALMTLIHILSTVAANSRVGRDRGTAARTLQGL